VAWRPDGKIAGFCSAALLPVEGKGDVLHLGLTCVRPDNRSGGLTHTLTSRVLVQYLVQYRPFSKVWVSNVACVLSSLGNVAMHFEEIYPSPFGSERPSPDHMEVARSIDYYYRDKIYIAGDSRFDAAAFVFRGSVKDTCFQKGDDDQRFFHRDRELNEFYQNLMSFDNGDEVLQVGYVTLMTYVKYAAKKLLPKGPGPWNLATNSPFVNGNGAECGGDASNSMTYAAALRQTQQKLAGIREYDCKSTFEF